MRNLPLIFLGVFFTLAFSWTGIVLIPHLQFGDLELTSSELIEDPATPGEFIVDPDADLFPRELTGAATRGKAVYMQMGCIYCHSQQVRRRGFGADFDRGWGSRQTVPHDYILQDRVLLGTMRTGPDLKTIGQRQPDPAWHHVHLYDSRVFKEGSIMPPYMFLYDVIYYGGPEIPTEDEGFFGRDVEVVWDGTGDLPAGTYLLPPQGASTPDGGFAPGPGYAIVPSQRANDLVAYLQSLRLDYDLPYIQRQ